MSEANRFEVACWRLERPPTGIRFGPDGDRLHAYDGRTVYTWNVPGFEEVGRFSVSESEQSREGHCRFTDDGRSLLLVASDDGSSEGIHHVTVRDLSSEEVVVDGNVHVEHYGLMTILLNRAEDRLLITDCEGTSHFVELPSCEMVRSVVFDAEDFADLGAACRHKLYSPDESELWEVCGYDESDRYCEYLTAFDPETGKGVRRQEPDEGDHVDGMALTPQGDALLTVEEDALCLLDPESWSLLGKIDLTDALSKGWGRSQPALALAPGAPLVAVSCEYNQRVCIADYEASRLTGVFDVAEEFCTRLLSFSPDGRRLAIASYDSQNEVRVWDLSRT